MKSLWTAIVAAFSTFSILPTPRIEWNETSLKNVLPALPLVGVVIGHEDVIGVPIAEAVKAYYLVFVEAFRRIYREI